jgi:Fe-S-cluster-containing hydrogenase component 2/CRP-like cAMP-binding protein
MPLEPLTPEQLRDVPLLQGVAADARESLRPHLFRADFAEGDRIAAAGAYLDGAFYLLAGTVHARVPAPEGESTAIAAGSVFGEDSALSRYPLAADITAASEVSALFIRTPGLRLMFDLPELGAFKAAFDRDYRERMLRACLGRTGLFAGIDAEAIEALTARAELVTYKPGKAIALEGSPCDAFYVVRGGYLQLAARMGDADVTLSYVRPGEWVGETALVLNEPWPFSLTAVEHVELARISLEDVRRALPDGARDPGLWEALVRRLSRRGEVIDNPLAHSVLQFTAESGLIHGESVLLIDLERCTRCDECVRGCADAHGGVPRFVREGGKFRNFSIATACYHCTDPVCMIGCPTGAITRPLGTREVAVDAGTCIGCGNCVRRCPWGNILTVQFDSPRVGQPIALATKCDLCAGRADGPACVQMCPQGCAQRVNFKDLSQVEAVLAR